MPYENADGSPVVIDRDYFWAIYFRTPGGVLFEVATNEPGFATDEDTAHLGEALKLLQHLLVAERYPEWLRDEGEVGPPLSVDVLERFFQTYHIHLMPMSTDDDPVSTLQTALGRRTH